MPFVPVARLEEIPEGQGLLVERQGRTLALFRVGDRVHACGSVCPHEGGPLAEGWIEGEVVVCPWHAYEYELATGRCRVDPDLAIPVYPVRVVEGVVEVDLP